MTQVAISGAALLGCLLIFAFSSHAYARSDADTLLNSSEILSFDIPEQPLSDALAAYSRLTDISVLLDSEFAARRAPAVQGHLTRTQALAGVLSGSNLAAFFVGNRSIVVREPSADERGGTAQQRPLTLAQISGVRVGRQDYGFYVARVQQAVRHALCASPQTRPGRSRLAMQVWVNMRGQVQRWNLLSSTGDAARDAAIGRILDGLSVGASPSPSMPQPIVMLLAPASRYVQADCPAGPGG